MRLVAGAAEAVIDPDVGAGLVSLTWDGRAILSATDGRDPSSPFAQAMNLLVPFSNRISKPFPFGGQDHDVAPNFPGERFAIHGDAFQRVWTVERAGADSARLTLSGGIGPFLYDAVLDYSLTETGLATTVRVTNRAAQTLPYGGGFHPWFPRHPETRLTFRAQGYWPEDDRNLPTTTAPVPAPGDACFDSPSPLPDRFINNGFAGWDGQLVIDQPGLRIGVSAPGLSTLLLYSPASDAPFFCAEPVSHPVDAFNLPGQPGLTPLAPKEALTMTMSISWTHA